MADRHAWQEPEQHRLPRQREGPGDEGLGGDHGGEAGKDHQRVGRRARGHHRIEGVGRRRWIPQQERALSKIGKHERRQHQPDPGPADRLETEVAHVGVESLAAGDDEHHRAENQQPVEAMSQEEFDGIPRAHRGEHCGLADELVYPQTGQRQKPDEHDRSEQPAHDSRARPLDGEEAQQDQAGDRHHAILEGRAGHGEPLHGTEHGDGRCDHAIAIEQGGADHGQQCHARHAADATGPGTIPFRHERQQRQDASFAVMVGPHHEHDVFDGDHQDQRPEHQRQDAEQVDPVEGLAVGGGDVEAFLERVEWARADVAKHDAQRAERELPDPGGSAVRCVRWRARGVAGFGRGHGAFLRSVPVATVGGCQRGGGASGTAEITIWALCSLRSILTLTQEAGDPDTDARR